MPQTTAAYDPTVFDVTSMREAMDIILTEESDGFATDRRWTLETPHLAELATRELDLGPSSLVLDYGCGVGRLSKALIEASGCSVVGVDISHNMRTLATRYVSDPRFTVLSPEMFRLLVRERGVLFDEAISVWVLQHCPRVAEDIAGVRRSLGLGGRLLVVNEVGRCVPTDRGWVHDGTDVRGLLRQSFVETWGGALPPAVAPAKLIARSYCGVYQA